MRLQPLPEQRTHFPRQAQRYVARIDGAGFRGRRQYAFEVGLGHERDHRRNADADRDARIGQGADGSQAPHRSGRAGFQGTRHLRVERGQRHCGHCQPPRSHFRQQINVAFNEGRFRDQRHRVLAFVEYFKQPPCQPQLAFARLIRIGIDAKGDWLRHMRGFCQLLPEQFGRVDLGENFALEIQPRREPEITVGGPRETINTPVLAAPVGIERYCEGHVGRPVAAQDTLGVFLDHQRLPC